MENYFVIHRTEDETYCTFLTKEEVEQRCSEDWVGHKFLDEFPCDLMSFPSWSVFIMRGEVIIPKAVKVVEKWKV